MENASKALLIAGGVLIALLVISIGVYLVLSASGVSENFDKSMSDSEIERFNKKFEVYEKQAYYVHDSGKGEERISESEINGSIVKEDYSFTNYNNISEVVSAINLAYSVNKSMEYDETKGVQVTVDIRNNQNTF